MTNPRELTKVKTRLKTQTFRPAVLLSSFPPSLSQNTLRFLAMNGGGQSPYDTKKPRQRRGRGRGGGVRGAKRELSGYSSTGVGDCYGLNQMESDREREESRDWSSPRASDFDKGYFQSYAHVGIHEEMIKVCFLTFTCNFLPYHILILLSVSIMSPSMSSNIRPNFALMLKPQRTSACIPMRCLLEEEVNNWLSSYN